MYIHTYRLCSQITLNFRGYMKFENLEQKAVGLVCISLKTNIGILLMLESALEASLIVCTANR